MKNTYVRFNTALEANSWIEKYKMEFPQETDVDVEFIDAIKNYTSSANVPINNHLRFDNSLIKATDIVYPIKQKLLDKLPEYQIPDNIVAYRYIPINVFTKLLGIWPLKKGMLITDNGFCSVSLLPHGADRHKEEKITYLHFEIAIPSGTAGTYVGLVSEMDEYEILLAPGAKFRIDSIYFPFIRKLRCTLI